jgi:3-hydroxyacyl-CoA dehydrogenase
MITDFFAPLGMKIAGGIALALAIALGITLWRYDVVSKDRDELQAWQTEVWGATKLAADRPKLAKDQVALQITYLGNGVDLLERTIADLNAQAEQRAEAFAEAQELAAEREKELAGLRRSSDAVVSRLRALSEREGQCAVPDDLRELAEGL